MWEWHHKATSTGDTASNSFSILTTRTARKHESLMARNMMSNHTDMQDKYCGDSYDIHLIQSQYKGTHKRGGGRRPPSLLWWRAKAANFVYAL